MKQAWEWDYEMFSGAVPVKDRTDLIQWDNLLEGKFLEEARQMLESGKGAWTKPLPESKAPYSKMLGAISSMANMGYDVTEADKLIPLAFDAIREDRLIDLQVLNARVFKALAEAPKIEGHPYWSCVVYESFEQYLQNAQLCEYPDYRLPGREELFDRVHAGWLGEIIGSALGTAVEGFKSSRLWEVFGEIDGYVKPPETLNDDITFELALLEAFREKGYAIDSDDIADKWVGLIPFAYTAEEVALRHMRSGIYPPQSGYLVNPYREMIGAAMRAAICGALAPAGPGWPPSSPGRTGGSPTTTTASSRRSSTRCSSRWPTSRPTCAPFWRRRCAPSRWTASSTPCSSSPSRRARNRRPTARRGSCARKNTSTTTGCTATRTWPPR